MLDIRAIETESLWR